MVHPLSDIIEDHYKRMEDGDFINIAGDCFSYDIPYDESLIFEDNYMTVYPKELKKRRVISTFNLDHITVVRFVHKKEGNV